MTHATFIETLAAQTDLPKSSVAKVVNALKNIVHDEVLIREGEVMIPNFGKWKVKKVAGGTRFSALAGRTPRPFCSLKR